MWRLIGAIVWQAVWAVSFAFANFQLGLNFDLPMAALAGAFFGGLVWMLASFSHAQRYLNWLREGDMSKTPKLLGVWGEVTDRTRRFLKKQNSDLQASNHRLDDFLSAIQASPNGVVLLDQQERIEWCNLTAASHFGLNPATDIAQHIGNLVRDPNFKTYIAAADFVNAVTINGKNSTSNQISRLSVHIHSYGLGKKLVLSNDITAIEAAEAMRRDFVANVSHEIRTPLTVLSGFVETLQTLDLDADARAECLNLMAQQSQRMQSLVNDLLILSKLEGSPAPLIDAWIDVDQLLGSCAREAKALHVELYSENTADSKHRQQSQSIEFQVQSGIELAGSQAELLSAMCNLANNAVRYTPLGGTIRVSFQMLDRGGAIFSVNDSGLGIAPEHLPRLTERFYRVDTSRSRDSGGTGLGLAIVKHVVQRHGGELKIASSLGQGSTFCFTLPEYRARYKNLEL